METLQRKRKGNDWQDYYRNLALLYYRYMQDTHQEVTLDTPAMRIKHFADFREKDMKEMNKRNKK